MERLGSQVKWDKKPRRGIDLTMATPNGALPLAMAAMLLNITEDEMREIARDEKLWFAPPAGTYSIKIGIRGRFIDTLRFDKYCEAQKRKTAKAEGFRERMVRDIGD